MSALPLLGPRKLGFMLACDIEAGTTKSGFVPAEFHLETGLWMGGNARLRGSASLLRMGVVETLMIVGRWERRFPESAVNQAEAIARILELDYEMEPSRISWIPSEEGTGANVDRIQRSVDGLPTGSWLVISNEYHLPRVQQFFEPIRPRLVSAEAIWLAEAANDPSEQKRRKAILLREIANAGERILREIAGVAAHLSGSYHSSYGGKTA